MENPTKITKALQEIYAELEQIQSARSQVVQITKATKDVVAKIDNYSKDIRTHTNEKVNESVSKISDLASNLVEVESKITADYKENKKGISDLLEQFKAALSVVSEKYQVQLTSIDDATKNLIGILKNDILDKQGEIVGVLESARVTAEEMTSSNRDIIRAEFTSISTEIHKHTKKNDELVEYITSQNIEENLQKSQQTTSEVLTEFATLNALLKKLSDSIKDTNTKKMLTKINTNLDRHAQLFIRYSSETRSSHKRITETFVEINASFEKLFSELTNTMQSILSNIDKSESSIINKIKTYSQSQTEALLGLQEELGASVNRLNDEIEASKRSNRIFHIVTWILLVGLGVMLVITK